MEKKDVLVSTVKGIITGIASLIPGISPSSCIVSVSSYEEFITGISSIFSKKDKKTKQHNKQMLTFITIPIIIGLLIGLIAGNHLVGYFLSKYTLQTIFLFIGLITGGIYMIFKTKKTHLTKKTTTVFIISSIIIFILYIVITKYITFIPNAIIPIIGGIITSTALIPSISLIYIYNLLDKYSYITTSITTLPNIKSILILIVFIITLIVSLILISKLTSYFFKKYKEESYIVICSLMILSIVILILEVGNFTISFVNIFTTILTFLWGILLAKNIEKE